MKQYVKIWLSIAFFGTLILSIYSILYFKIFKANEYQDFSHDSSFFISIAVLGLILSLACSFPSILFIYFVEERYRTRNKLLLHTSILLLNGLFYFYMSSPDQEGWLLFGGYYLAGVTSYLFFKRPRKNSNEILDDQL